MSTLLLAVLFPCLSLITKYCELVLLKLTFCDQSSDEPVVNEASCNNFATIRTTSIVKQQQREKLGRDFMREQMTNYRQIRRQHSRQLQQVIFPL